MPSTPSSRANWLSSTSGVGRRARWMRFGSRAWSCDIIAPFFDLTRLQSRLCNLMKQAISGAIALMVAIAVLVGCRPNPLPQPPPPQPVKPVDVPTPPSPGASNAPVRTDWRPGAVLPRAGDEIMVCGQLFHTGAPVILWTDPGGYDAYRTERRFASWDVADFESTAKEL